MPRGRPRTLVKEFYRGWPIECLPQLPRGLKGLYVLYNSDGHPLKVGISGRGKQDVWMRMYNEYHLEKSWRAVDHFSVFTFTTRTWFEQAERLILRAVGTALAGNVNAGEVMVRSGVVEPPARQRIPRNFMRRRVNDVGYVKVGEKYRGRAVRVEVGSKAKTG